jgi:hypothetical protein
MSNLFFILALVSVVLGTVTWIMIVSFLSKRGIKINYLLLKVLIVRYVKQYRRITIEENGKPGLVYPPISESLSSSMTPRTAT